MAHTTLTNKRLFFDGYELTSRSNAVTIDYSVDTLDNTTLDDTTKSVMPGLKTAAMQFEGFYDPDTVDVALFSAVASSGKVMTVGTSTTEGEVAYTMQSMLAKYTPLQGSVGEMVGFSAGGVSQKSPIVRGSMILRSTNISSSGTGTAYSLGAASTQQRVYASLHTLGVSSSGDTLTVKIQSAASSGFSSFTTQLTFTTVAGAVGSQWTSCTGNITDTWWRAVYSTVGGTSPGFNVLATVGIL